MIIKKLCIFICLQLVAMALWANGLDSLQEQLKGTTDPNKQVELLYDMSLHLAHTDLELSIQYAEQGIQLATKNNDKKNSALINSLLGKLYLEQGQKKDALEKMELAISIAKESELKKIEAISVINLGYYWYRLGDSTKTISNYSKGFDLYNELEDKDGIAQSYLKLGWGYALFGDYEQAEKSFQNAVNMKSSIKDTTLLINVLTGMGAFYINRSIKQHQAIQYLEESLELSKLQGKNYNIGRTYNALGFLYRSLDNNEIAKSFYFKGLEIFKEQNNKAELCWLYIRLGELFVEEKELDKALDYFEQALEIVDDVDRSVMFRSEIYMAIGLVHRERGVDYNEALKFLKESWTLSKGTKNSYQTMETEVIIGTCYIAKNQLSEGKKWCEMAFKKAKNHLILSQEACDCLYKASQGLGDFKSALSYHEQLKVLTDSLHKEELSEEINNLAAKQAYEMDLADIQKTQEITAANMRIKSIQTIAAISFIALFIIMLLLLSNVKKTAQKEQLQALSIVRKEMIANVSHDLRTPITVMIGYVETLLMRIGKTSEADQKKYLNIVMNSAQHLSQLIAQLFEYSKLEAKQIDPVKEAFQLKDLVKETFSRYQILAEKKEIQIKLNCPDDIPVVYADAILIERVIQNLMDNALKFTPKHGVISVCVSNNQDKVQVEIADTGKGISKEKQDLIFERYEKSKSSNGSGLGLTIVKNILDMHGSTINVNSKVNGGTKFTFNLPTS